MDADSKCCASEDWLFAKDLLWKHAYEIERSVGFCTWSSILSSIEPTVLPHITTQLELPHTLILTASLEVNPSRIIPCSTALYLSFNTLFSRAFSLCSRILTTLLSSPSSSSICLSAWYLYIYLNEDIPWDHMISNRHAKYCNFLEFWQLWMIRFAVCGLFILLADIIARLKRVAKVPF